MAEYLCEEDMNTGEYISRDLALKQLNATCLATDCDNYNGVRCRACAYADAMDFIDAIPAADVQPVNQCKMIPQNPDCRGYTDTFFCTNCQLYIHLGFIGQRYGGNYCIECGAEVEDGDTE